MTNLSEAQFLSRLTLLAAVTFTLLGLNSFSPALSSPPPDFGPNVLVFDPSMPAATIQSRLNAVFKNQESNQFGSERYAYFFKPGHYTLDVNVGFYTQVLGLGQSPDAVTISGAVHSEANWLGNGNATCNFWRSCENLAAAPLDNTPLHWAVSQGTALRRVHIKGNLNLWDRGWSSGGFLADSKIDGQVNSGTQQQWFSRNADWNSWTGRNWNMTFVGVTRPPSGAWPTPPYTVVAQTPLIREKPYLFLDEKGSYAVRVPSLHSEGTTGISWGSDNQAAGVSVPLDKFYLAHAGTDTAATLNTALRGGRHLLLTPGIYHLETSLLVTRPGTIILGLGYATLVPDKGTPALTISDLDGVTVGGIIFDAGPIESPALLQIGTPDNTPNAKRKNHAKNPVFLYDIVARVGGATVGTASSCVRVSSNDVVGDNFWLWRADHGAGADWNENKCKNGLIVEGENVTLYGLFVEHFQEYQTLWNGNGGRVYFYQSELPYDAPSQSEWQHEGIDGFASYKVADGVTRHEAWGLGVYGVFNRSAVKCFNAIETPTSSDVKMHHLISVWITGKKESEITHIINGTGEAVNHLNRKATVN